MKRSQLKNKANKTKDPRNILKYKKQRSYVVKLINLSRSILKPFSRFSKPFWKFKRDSTKPFWKNCKRYISNKHPIANSKIVLNENGEVFN